MLGLGWKHIDLSKGTIQITQSIPGYINGVPIIKESKTKGSVKKIALPASLIQELVSYKKHWNELKIKNNNKWFGENEFLFCNKNGMPLHPKSLTDMWREFTKANKTARHIRLHDLRHTSATLLIN